jgi:hypothetical protein
LFADTLTIFIFTVTVVRAGVVGFVVAGGLVEGGDLMVGVVGAGAATTAITVAVGPALPELSIAVTPYVCGPYVAVQSAYAVWLPGRLSICEMSRVIR